MDALEIILDDGAYMPVRANNVDAGLDLKSKTTEVIPPHGSAIFNTGVHVNIPSGYVGFLKSKSGLNTKFNILGTGVIDAGYTGSIVVKLYNFGNTEYCVGEGDKIIQLVILPIVTPSLKLVESFTKGSVASDRGDKGFGSSGR